MLAALRAGGAAPSTSLTFMLPSGLNSTRHSHTPCLINARSHAYGLWHSP